MMTMPDLAELASRARHMREGGIALIAASAVLAAFLFVPLTHEAAPAAAETPPAPAALTPAPIEANAAIVYDLATGQTLYEKNADAQLPLASLTKLLTVYAALRTLPPGATVTVSAAAAAKEAPRAFSPGDTFTLANLARLTLTGSLNDGAAAIAEAASSYAERPTADVLAGAAAGLDLAQTYAVNGSGLDENAAVSGGYGSARDVAVLAGALQRAAPDIALATTLPAAKATSMSGAPYEVKNTDPIVSTVPRLLLSKTGYTDLAGGNLVLIFDAGIAHPIAVVVLGSTKDARFTDAAALVAAALARFAGVNSL